MTHKDTLVYVRLTNMLRDAKLSTLYYQNRLWWTNFWYLTFEIFIAAGTAAAAGTGLAALTIWQHGPGLYVWSSITIVATVLAFLKPIVAPGTKLQIYSRQHHGWYSLYFSVERLLLNIRQSDKFSEDDYRIFSLLFDRQTALNLSDVKCLNRRLVNRLKSRVDEEIPAESLSSMPLEDRDNPSDVRSASAHGQTPTGATGKVRVPGAQSAKGVTIGVLQHEQNFERAPAGMTERPASFENAGEAPEPGERAMGG
jgi:hypothetical protein